MDKIEHAPLEEFHKDVVGDIASAIGHTLYSASIKNVSYQETTKDGTDTISTISIDGANGSHFVAQEANLHEYEFLDWVMHQFLRFLREESL